MKKEPEIEAIGDGRFRVTNFISEMVDDPCGNHLNCGRRSDIPIGYRINLIVIEVKGSLNITALEIRFEHGRVLRPLPVSILRCHPIAEGHSAYICFEPPLDLRNEPAGLTRIAMTIEEYNSGDKFFISYGTEFILKEDD